MIAGNQERMHRDEDRLFGAGEGVHVVDRDSVVQLRDLGPEQRVPRCLRVAEPEVLPEIGRLVVGERDQLGHRDALDVACTQVVRGGELPSCEIPLEEEVVHLHGSFTLTGRDTAACRALIGGRPVCL
jgi:hypothetical protein